MKKSYRPSVRRVFAFTSAFTLLAGSLGAAGAKTDSFEEIAKQKTAKVPGLANNPAITPKLPKTTLPWDASPRAGFAPGEKMTTQAQFDAELARLRGQYAPFLRDLAPPIAKRPQLELDTFDWRLAQKVGDATELADALAGRGEWKRVSIPHYAGPVGRVESFYRKTVDIGDDLLSKGALFLHFDGVDYYASVYVNGVLAGTHEGLFDAFEFDIRPFVKPGKNVILVKAGNDGCPIGTAKIFGGGNYAYGPKMAACGGPGWDDPKTGWICCPVGFGLWQRCRLEARPAVFLNDVFVRPLADLKHAEVWVEIAGPDAGAKGPDGLAVSYSLYGQNFETAPVESVPVTAKPEPGEVGLFASPQPADAKAKRYPVRRLKFTMDMPAARLWSPETPNLYQLQVTLTHDGKPADAFSRQFGMRTFTQSATSVPKGRFYLNGEQIRLRGANMMGNLMQCVVRRDTKQLVDDILIAKMANMNFWRMTQQPCQDEVYAMFDRVGLLAQSDMPTFFAIPQSQEAEFLRESGAQLRLVRGHACAALVSYINEPYTGSKGGVKRMSVRDEIALFRKADALRPETDPDRVVKWVDGDYLNMSETYSDHHCYNLWYQGHAIPFRSQYRGAWVSTRGGWMCGCGEYGVEGSDSADLIRRRYPKDWYEKDGQFTPSRLPIQAARPDFQRWLSRWAKPNPTLDDWCDNSREHQELAVGLQTEAFRRMAKINSIALHLLIDAWPAGWCKSVVDCERKPKPAYFAFRDALTPLAVNLRPNHFFAYSGEPLRTEVWICDDLPSAPAGATLRYQFEDAGKVIATGETPAKIVASEPTFQGWLDFPAPAVATRKKLTLRVALFDASGKRLHESSKELEVLPTSLKSEKPRDAGGRMEFLIGA